MSSFLSLSIFIIFITQNLYSPVSTGPVNTSPQVTDIPCNNNEILPIDNVWSYCNNASRVVHVGTWHGLGEGPMERSGGECIVNKNCSVYADRVCVNEEDGRRACYWDPFFALPSFTWTIAHFTSSALACISFLIFYFKFTERYH